jgi:hypothetical protein
MNTAEITRLLSFATIMIGASSLQTTAYSQVMPAGSDISRLKINRPAECRPEVSLCGYPGDEVTSPFYYPGCTASSCGTQTWYAKNLPAGSSSPKFNPATTSGTTRTTFTTKLSMTVVPKDYYVSIGANCSGKTICTPGTFTFQVLYFEKQIPEIMRAKNWVKPAALMERWLDATSFKIAEGDYTKKLSSQASIDTTTITMAWLLDTSVDPRQLTKKGYDSLVTPSSSRYFLSTNAKLVLQKRIIALLPANQTSAQFGNFAAKGKALHEQHTQSAVVQSFSTFSNLDQLVAAMGNFQLSAIPKGAAQKTATGDVTVTITDVGIYAIDSYDFNGSQPLGCWKAPNSVSIGLLGCGAAYSASNASFEKYRVGTKKGGDFIIMSDVKKDNLKKAITCRFKLSAPSTPMTCA